MSDENQATSATGSNGGHGLSLPEALVRFGWSFICRRIRNDGWPEMDEFYEDKGLPHAWYLDLMRMKHEGMDRIYKTYPAAFSSPTRAPNAILDYARRAN